MGHDPASWTRLKLSDVVAFTDGYFNFPPFRPWPEVTPVRLCAGDAVVALHALPHCSTPNLTGTDRQSVYFRVRKLRPQNPHEVRADT